LELSKLDRQSVSKNDQKSEFSGTIKITNQAIIEDRTIDKSKNEISSGSSLEIVACNVGNYFII